MKLLSLVLVFALASIPLMAVEIGDTYEKVVDERGMPVSKVETGGLLILNYADSTIKLREDRVVWIKMAGVEAGDTYKKVVEAKGVPASKMEAGISAVLRYADSTIKLREGKVVSIKLTIIAPRKI